jgi:HlyD family secretion protein
LILRGEAALNLNYNVTRVGAKEAETALAESLKSLRIERSNAESPAGIERRAGQRSVRLPRGGLFMVGVVLALGLSGTFILYMLPGSRGAHRLNAAAAPTPAGIVAVAEPARSRALVASGYAVARRKATVAAEITGKVVDVLVEEGMVVKQGDVLARLDSVLDQRDLELAQSRAKAAEAAIGAITADLHDAETIYNRAQRLILSAVISEADFTKAETRVNVLRAQLKQAEAQFETAKLEAKRAADSLEKHNVRAPFNGVVIDVTAQRGEMISPLAVGGYTRTGICTVVDMDSIEVDVDVNEAFIARVVPGMAVQAVFDAYPDWTVPASVIGVVPTANREKATVKVRIKLKVKDPRILPDMAVKVSFESDDTVGKLPDSESVAN